jgi:[ribosomal protein S5]-alanine N-acetyltransferase
MSPQEVPKLILRGKRVTLRTPQLQDADRSYNWFADPEITRYLPLAGKGELPMDAIREFIKRVRGSERPELAVNIEVEGEYVGCGGLRNIDNGSAEFSIVIGERRFEGRGVAREAALLFLGHAFDTLSMETVWLIVRGDNQRALLCMGQIASLTIVVGFIDLREKNGLRKRLRARPGCHICPTFQVKLHLSGNACRFKRSMQPIRGSDSAGSQLDR